MRSILIVLSFLLLIAPVFAGSYDHYFDSAGNLSQLTPAQGLYEDYSHIAFFLNQNERISLEIAGRTTDAVSIHIKGGKLTAVKYEQDTNPSVRISLSKTTADSIEKSNNSVQAASTALLFGQIQWERLTPRSPLFPPVTAGGTTTQQQGEKSVFQQSSQQDSNPITNAISSINGFFSNFLGSGLFSFFTGR
jgi:hypothetical protein